MKIISLTGMLGYGYDRDSLVEAFRNDPPEYIGVDAGSSDPGPYYLGAGKAFTNRNAVKRDTEIALLLAIEHHIPFVIGTAGGSGSSEHLLWMREIIEEIAKEHNLSFKMACIYTDVDTEYLLKKYQDGKVIPLGPQIQPDEESIRSCTRIVSQIGAGPIMEALENGAQVVLAGRACDTAIYAAPCLMKGYDPGLAYHMAKIMECGSLCAKPAAAADGMIAVIEKDYFELTPSNPIRSCNITSVAAHTLYEQSSPYFITEPDGTADLRNSVYEQITDRTVRVSKSTFKEAETKTLKLEGVSLAGYRTISFAEICDPATIAHIDTIFAGVVEFVAQNLGSTYQNSDYTIQLRKYGVPAPLADATSPIPTTNAGVLIDVIGKTQAIADTVCSLVRSRMLHYDYEGRKSTAGNLAFPFSPSDISMGAVYRFSFYHLVAVDDLNETSHIEYEQIGGSNNG